MQSAQTAILGIPTAVSFAASAASAASSNIAAYTDSSSRDASAVVSNVMSSAVKSIPWGVLLPSNESTDVDPVIIQNFSSILPIITPRIVQNLTTILPIVTPKLLVSLDPQTTPVQPPQYQTQPSTQTEPLPYLSSLKTGPSLVPTGMSINENFAVKFGRSQRLKSRPMFASGDMILLPTKGDFSLLRSRKFIVSIAGALAVRSAGDAQEYLKTVGLQPLVLALTDPLRETPENLKVDAVKGICTLTKYQSGVADQLASVMDGLSSTQLLYFSISLCYTTLCYAINIYSALQIIISNCQKISMSACNLQSSYFPSSFFIFSFLLLHIFFPPSSYFFPSFFIFFFLLLHIFFPPSSYFCHVQVPGVMSTLCDFIELPLRGFKTFRSAAEKERELLTQREAVALIQRFIRSSDKAVEELRVNKRLIKLLTELIASDGGASIAARDKDFDLCVEKALMKPEKDKPKQGDKALKSSGNSVENAKRSLVQKTKIVDFRELTTQQMAQISLWVSIFDIFSDYLYVLNFSGFCHSH